MHDVSGRRWSLTRMFLTGAALIVLLTGCSLFPSGAFPIPPGEEPGLINLVQNPNFVVEPGQVPEGWQRRAGLIGTHVFFVPRDDGKEGNMLYANQPGGDQEVAISLRTVPIEAEPGSTFYASAFIRTEPTAKPLILIHFLDANMNQITEVGSPPATSSDWELVELEATAPEGTHYVQLQLRCSAVTGQGVPYEGETYFKDPFLARLDK